MKARKVKAGIGLYVRNSAKTVKSYQKMFGLAVRPDDETPGKMRIYGGASDCDDQESIKR